MEQFFEMQSGYVLDFTDRTFRDFVLESTNTDPYQQGYDVDGTSKANRLRHFWKTEPNYLVVKLVNALLEYKLAQSSISGSSIKTALYQKCLSITARLGADTVIDDVEAFRPNSKDKDFDLLAASIRDSIRRGEAGPALDRLHTFLIHYLRELSTKHAIPYHKETPLHSLMGAYVKFLDSSSLLESDISRRILKSSLSLLDGLNAVRNDQSFAHANPLLNHNESVLIFNNVSNVLRFIDSLEKRISEAQSNEKVDWDNLEFSDEEVEAAGDAWIQQQLDIKRGK